MRENLMKAGRDLLVLLLATTAFYVSENVTNFGLPDQAVAIVGAVALLIYRSARPIVRSG